VCAHEAVQPPGTGLRAINPGFLPLKVDELNLDSSKGQYKVDETKTEFIHF